MGTLPRRHRRRIRHHRMGRQATLVQRQGRHARTFLRRTCTVARRHGRASEPRYDLPAGRFHKSVPRLDHPQRRLAAVVQLRMGRGAAGIAHHAERRSAQPARTGSDQLRQSPLAPAAEHNAEACRAQRTVLQGLAGAPRLRRLLEEDQCRRSVREDRHSRPYPGRLVRHLQPGYASRIRRHEQARQDRTSAA